MKLTTAKLENRRGFTLTVGSNPTPSANISLYLYDISTPRRFGNAEVTMRLGAATDWRADPARAITAGIRIKEGDSADVFLVFFVSFPPLRSASGRAGCCALWRKVQDRALLIRNRARSIPTKVTIQAAKAI